MKLIITFFFLSAFLQSSLAQVDTAGVFIPKDDASVFKGEIDHIWVGIKNPIAPLPASGGKIIKLWTDNGTTGNTGSVYITNTYVKPAKPGKVTVYTKQTVWKEDGKYDTVTTKNVFTAIVQPKVNIAITKDNFKGDTTIQFGLRDKSTGKPMGDRYKVGRIYTPQIYDTRDTLMGKVPLCSGNTIEAWNFENFLKYHEIKPGYKMKFMVLIRDLKTDLILPSERVVYTFK